MKVRKQTIGLVSLLLLLLATSCGRRIEGVVTDEKGQPIEKADVMVFDAQDKRVAHITSDADGQYSVPVNKGKPYSIGVYKFGFELATRRIAADSSGLQNFPLTVRRVHKKGDRMRVLDSGWCPGTIVGINKENELYDVELDSKPSMKATITTKPSEIRPLDGETSKSKLPCSHFEN
jgi:hypothetical protein